MLVWLYECATWSFGLSECTQVFPSLSFLASYFNGLRVLTKSVSNVFITLIVYFSTPTLPGRSSPLSLVAAAAAASGL